MLVIVVIVVIVVVMEWLVKGSGYAVVSVCCINGHFHCCTSF